MANVTHHCSACGSSVEEFCADHPCATVESVLVTGDENVTFFDGRSVPFDQAVILYTLVSLWYENNSATIAPKRIERLIKAIELGANKKALEALATASRTSEESTIILPSHRYENLSRGKGWARQGKGASAVWGERDDGGYRVGPGKWTVGGNDGFSRKGETQWTVKNVTVGTEIWTVAS